VIINKEILNRAVPKGILRVDGEMKEGLSCSEIEPELLGRLMKVMKEQEVDATAKNNELADIINIIKLKYSGSQVVQNI
jgi:hypothetical protein